MSRAWSWANVAIFRFPRVSGDEPKADPAPEPEPTFSPRERG